MGVRAAAPDVVTVFAAASTTNLVTAIGQRFEQKQLGRCTLVFAASSTLAKQIAQGAPADIFLSANAKWMDYLQKRRLLAPGSRVDLLGNRVVLIAPLGSAPSVRLEPGVNLAGRLGDGKLAMGDPDHVPAGMYGKSALESLKIWPSVSGKTARCKDVRAALALVERAEAPLGVVYATDAAISKKVAVVAVFPEWTHTPIMYPVAAVDGRLTPAAKAFLGFLISPDSAAVFKRYGFLAR